MTVNLDCVGCTHYRSAHVEDSEECSLCNCPRYDAPCRGCGHGRSRHIGMPGFLPCTLGECSCQGYLNPRTPIPGRPDKPAGRGRVGSCGMNETDTRAWVAAAEEHGGGAGLESATALPCVTITELCVADVDRWDAEDTAAARADRTLFGMNESEVRFVVAFADSDAAVTINPESILGVILTRARDAATAWDLIDACRL